MDGAAQKFRSATADFSADQYTAVVQSHEMQKGTTAFRRNGNAVEMAVHIVSDNDQPSERQLLYKDGELDYYQASIKQETIFSAGANRQQYESFLTLGFGGSGRDLTASWNVTLQGMEAIDGVQTAKLDLVSKQDSVRNNFSHITVWIDPSRSISLKQVFYAPSGDTRTVTYSNIRYNTSVSSSVFTLHAAPGTVKVRK
ncbi:outer membrane lipoprotein-sorting protein [Acidipila sp. 4G-K13]|uniref:Outer membrane lipoprotein-sorting protein n=2 Tax=Paracidobacterium acidisoli TaxID=2303751 RepID=A0A372IL57_9BACT|nr:outer membrane lipoprotein-sorting protein [Paracidobacterium acidisoli]